jgi:F-type H+-transporting ATPase subunit b
MILLMIYILNRTFFRPINRILEARDKQKGGHSFEADAIMQQVEDKSTQYNKEMLDARNMGYELVAKEHKKAVDARVKKLEKAKADIAAKFEAERAELEKQKAEARVAIGTEAEKMAEKIAGDIIGA